MPKSAFLHRLETPESVKERPDFEILLKCVREKDPSYIPPDFTTNIAQNSLALRKMAMDAYSINAIGLVKACLNRTICSLAEIYCKKRVVDEPNTQWKAVRPISISEFHEEAVAWYARHLTDCEADKRKKVPGGKEKQAPERSVELFNGTGWAEPENQGKTSDSKQERPRAISSNCLAYWNPQLGGLITHVRMYSKQKLHPGLLEHMVEQRRTDGTIEHSLEEAIDLLERNGHKEFKPWDETALPILRPVASMSSAITERQMGPPTNERILTWVRRHRPEMEERMVRGSRAERLGGLKSAVTEVLTEHASEFRNGRYLLQSVKTWDPRKSDVDDRFPQMAAVLQRDERREIITEKLQRDRTLSMFDVSTHLDFDGEAGERKRGWWENQARWVDNSKPVVPDSKVAADAHAFFEGAGSNEAAREKMNSFIQQAFAPDEKTASEKAEIIESLRQELTTQNQQWDFSRRGPDVLLGSAIKACCTVSDPENEYTLSGVAFDRIAAFQNQQKATQQKQKSQDRRQSEMEF